MKNFSLCKLMGLCLCLMIAGVACDDKKPEPVDPPDPPVTKGDSINYIKSVKHVRTFAEELAPVTNEYAITYTEPDSEGHKTISQVDITSDASGTKSSVTYTYAYDEEGSLFISASFEDDPDKEYVGDFKFNSDGTIQRFARLRDKAYDYYYYSYNWQQQLESTTNPFDKKGGFWDIKWEDGNATTMSSGTEETIEAFPGAGIVECTFGEYENNYSIDTNGLLEDFLHHSFDNPIMPLFTGMKCRNLVSGISGDISDYIHNDEWGFYPRSIESDVTVVYETDYEDRVVKMTVTKQSKALNKPDPKIDDKLYYDIPQYNYTDVFEFTY